MREGAKRWGVEEWSEGQNEEEESAGERRREEDERRRSRRGSREVVERGLALSTPVVRLTVRPSLPRHVRGGRP